MDARAKAFTTIMRRLQRARDALRETLAQQQGERDDAQAQVATQQQVLARAAAEAARREARIDNLLDGSRAVRIEELLDWQATLADAVEQRRSELTALQRMQDNVIEIDGNIAATRSGIVRHDTRIELCHARLDGLRREAGLRAEDAQDEEAEEAFVGRRLARRARQTKIDEERVR